MQVPPMAALYTDFPSSSCNLAGTAVSSLVSPNTLSPKVTICASSLAIPSDRPRYVARNNNTNKMTEAPPYKILRRLFCLFTPAGISDFQAFQQFLRLNIYQLHLVSLVKDRIRDALPHKNTGNGRNHII